MQARISLSLCYVGILAAIFAMYFSAKVFEEVLSEEAVSTINIDGNIFELVVPLQIFKHGFEKQWQFERPEYLWVDDLKNDFYYRRDLKVHLLLQNIRLHRRIQF